MVPIQTSNTGFAQSPNNSTTHWHLRAHFAANIASNNPAWLLDSGASHHVTTDLSNLFLCAPYMSSDDVMIGDGTSLSITYTGSAYFLTPTTLFTLSDVLVSQT